MTARRSADPRRPGGAPSSSWRVPTRRAFVAMLGAAAAALAVDHRPRVSPAREPAEDDRPRTAWTGTTRWIGHC